MTTKVKRPVVFGAGLVALDLVIGADPKGAVQSWTGGTCGNVLTILAYLGWKSFPIARLNGDPASDRIRLDLERWGVALDFTECTPTAHTPIIIQQIRRDRHGTPKHRFLWSCPHCGQRLPSFRPITQEAVASIEKRLVGASVFFMDRLSRANLTLAAIASEKGAIVVFEPSGQSDEKLFSEAIKVAHVVKYSDQRLKSAPGAMKSGSATLLEVQTLGNKGLRYRHRLGKTVSQWFHFSAIPAPHLVDTCGSGDWCTAGLIAKVTSKGQAGLRSGSVKLIREALRYGQALAAWNCGFEGARGGMYAVSRETFASQIGALLAGEPIFSSEDRKPSTGEAIACPACPPNSTRRTAIRAGA